MPPAAVLGGLAGGSILSGIFGAKGANTAAGQQVAAAQQALQLEQQNQQKAIGVQQPYLDAGKQGLNSLSSLLSTPGQGLLQNYGQFQAPTLDEAKQNPGYQFALDSGVQALDKSAAARGTLMSGTQGAALEQFGQGLGEQNYNDVYNRALSSYGTNFNTFNTNQGNQFNRLGTLAGMGQQAANQSGNIYMGGAEQQAQQLNNIGSARAFGTMGAADAWGNMFQNLGELPLTSLLNGSNKGGYQTVGSGPVPLFGGMQPSYRFPQQ